MPPRVVRIGLTAVKGMAHLARPSLDLTPQGPTEDRMFCLVDPATGKVLRTIQHDRLLACEAHWEPPTLTISTPEGEVTGEVDTATPGAGRRLVADYWDRSVELVQVGESFTPLLSRYLDREVMLCRVLKPRNATRTAGVVWGGSVSIATTSSLAEVARRTARPVEDGRRFRATFVVDTGDAPSFVEVAWVGRTLRVGSAVVVVRGPLPRCAVIDRQPGVGGRDVDVLKALAVDRTTDRRSSSAWMQMSRCPGPSPSVPR